MKANKAVTKLLFLLIIVLAINQGQRVQADNTTISIAHTLDDIWRTSTGNVFYNTEEIIFSEPDYDMITYLRFLNIGLSGSSRIENATLRVYTSNTHGIDPNISATIYGVDVVDCIDWGNGEVWDLNRPLTEYYSNWNLSTVRGTGWHEVDVTDIIKSIVYKYGWGLNNDLGLIIYSASGQAYPRNFEDYSHSGDNQSQLLIYYDITPATPPGVPANATLLENYRDYDIWNYTIESRWLNYTEFTVVDSGQGTLTIIDSSNLTVEDVHFNGDVYAYQNNTDNAFTVMFGVNTTRLLDPWPGATEVWGLLYGATLNSGWWEDGQDFMALLAQGNDASAQHWRYQIFTDDGGAQTFTPVSSWFTKANKESNTHWLNLTWTGVTNEVKLDIYSDVNMTNLIETISQNLANTIPVTNYHYAFGTYDHNGGSNYNEIDAYLLSDIENDDNAGPRYISTDENGTIIDPCDGDVFTDLQSVKDCIDDTIGPDPLDPDPGTQNWPTTGPFTRFRMRLYVLIIGLGCIFTPLIIMAIRPPDPSTFLYWFIPIILGLGLLISLGNI